LAGHLDAFEKRQGFNAGPASHEQMAERVSGGAANSDEHAPAAPIGDKPPVLIGFVEPDVFVNFLIKYGYQWVDPGAGVDHGEFTHRIQWYLIAREIDKNGIDPRGLSLIEIYTAIADAGLRERPAVDGRTIRQSLWDVLVDRLRTNDRRAAEAFPETMYPTSTPDEFQRGSPSGKSARTPDVLYARMKNPAFPGLSQFALEQSRHRQPRDDENPDDKLLTEIAAQYFGGDRSALDSHLRESGARIPPEDGQGAPGRPSSHIFIPPST
jgi:hypothetical protein